MAVVSVFSGGSADLLIDIALIIVVATFFAYVLKLLKQPLVPAYILTGFLLGPFGFSLIKNQDVISTLSEFGIAFLLFVVGLQMDLRQLKKVGLISGIGGTLQVVLTFAMGFFVARYFGFTNMTSFYVGLIIAFSSTMIVVKLLSDGDELNTLHGKISVGILLMQDLLVILVLATLGVVGDFSIVPIGIALFKGVLLVLIGVLLSKTVLPSIFRVGAKSQELLFLMAITMSFLFSALSVYIGFSLVVGAFIAGVSLASLPYSSDIIGRVNPLKDFFATIFFVFLGMGLVFSDISLLLKPLIVLLVAVLLLKPLLITVISRAFGYGKRTAFLNSIYLAQISEFSLIVVAIGVSLGHVDQSLLSLTVVLAVITITVTTYLAKYRNSLYGAFAGSLGIFDKISFIEHKLEYMKSKKRDVILFGSHRMGSILVHSFLKERMRIFVVDYDPGVIDDLIKHKIPCMYGDIENEEVLKEVGVNKVKLVISTVPERENNMFILEHVKDVNPKALVFVTANHLHDAFDFYSKGADYVIFPHVITAERIGHLISSVAKRRKKIKTLRNNHLKHLTNIKLFGY